jgi:branched-chain amino acid transport system permease protein
MAAATSPSSGRGAARLVPIVGSALAVILLLIPYVFSLATGEPDGSLAGLARLHSASESVFCQEGLNPMGLILMVETGLLLVAQVALTVLGDRIGTAGRAIRQQGWYVLAVMVLVALPFFVGWRTESSVCERGKAFFWQSVFIEAFILAVLTISYNLMFGFTGVVSFGHAAFFGMGAYTVGLLMKHLAWPWWAAILATLAVGVLIALIKGFVGLRIKALAFAMFTLAFAQVFFILSGNRLLVNLTGAEDGFTFDVPDFLNATKHRLFYYYLALAVLLISYWLVRRLMNSPTGRVISAQFSNEDRARMLGYNTFYYKLIAIVLAGIMATTSGILRGIVNKGASPNLLGLAFTVDPLVMTIIGGQGTFLGPVVGAFGLHLVEHLLLDAVVTIGSVQVNIGSSWALILGIIFIVTVLVFPQGIVGTWLVRRLHTADGWRRLLRIKKDEPLT